MVEDGVEVRGTIKRPTNNATCKKNCLIFLVNFDLDFACTVSRDQPTPRLAPLKDDNGCMVDRRHLEREKLKQQLLGEGQVTSTQVLFCSE